MIQQAITWLLSAGLLFWLLSWLLPKICSKQNDSNAAIDASAKGTTLPSWEGKVGADRIFAEFMHLKNNISRGLFPMVSEVVLGNDVSVWRLKLKNFDVSSKGEQQTCPKFQPLWSAVFTHFLFLASSTGFPGRVYTCVQVILLNL